MKKHLPAKIFLFMLSGFFLSSCSITTKVPQGKYLLTKNIFKTNGKRALFSNLEERVLQRPNKKIFNFLPWGLMLYNQSDPKLDEAFTAYFSMPEIYREEGKEKTLHKLLLRYNLTHYVNKNLWWDKFLFKNGEKPVIIDSVTTVRSANNINQYYHSKGFFDATTSVDLSLKNKKGKIIYNTRTGNPYSIRSIKYRFQEPELERIFRKNLQFTLIKKGDTFSEENFKTELERVTNLYQNNGYYNFNPSNDDLFFEIDSTAGHHQIDVIMNVNEKNVMENGVRKTYPHKKYNFKEIEIKLQTSQAPTTLPIIYQGYKLFLPLSLKYKPKSLTDAILISPGGLYQNKDIIGTKMNLYSLQNFSINKFTIVEVQPDSSEPEGRLNASILLSPLKRYELQLSFETAISDFTNLGISPGISLLRRNLLGGAENFELFFKGNLTSIKKTSYKTKGFFNAWEISTQAKLYFPRFLLPSNIERLIPKRYNPRSTITARLNMQRNIGIGRLTLSNILSYTWDNSPSQRHKFNLINLQFIRNLEKDHYFDFYDNDRNIRDTFCKTYDKWTPGKGKHCLNASYDEALKMASNYQNHIDSHLLKQYLKMQNRRARIINDYLIHSISYDYKYDPIPDKRRKNPVFFNTRVETAGNLLSLLSKPLSLCRKKIGNKEPYTLFNVPYSQFVKIDMDLKKYWNFLPHQTLASRIFIGVAFPYGNSEQLPFDRSYFSGGSNDIRAWHAYDLGPGDTHNSLRDLSFSDLKLTLSAEYRFRIMSDLFSAFFLDAGNIWSLKGENTTDSSKFRWSTFYEQLALGGGIGFRYDLKFIITRVDLAYKLYNPARSIGERWQFNKLHLNQTMVNFAIGYPF